MEGSSQRKKSKFTTRALGLILHEDRYEFIAPKEITSLVAAIPMLQELIPVIESIATELK